MTNETTPDAVERQYRDSHGQPCDLATLCRREPGWAANRIDTLLAARARHAEEVARLEERLKNQTDWYQQRFSRLRRWVTEEVKPLSEEVSRRYFAICANGSPSPHEPADWSGTMHGLTAELTSLRDQLRQFELCRDDIGRLANYVIENEDAENPIDVGALVSAGLVEELLAGRPRFDDPVLRQLRKVEGERDKKQELLDKLALDLDAAYDHGNALERELKWVTAARDLARTERDSLRSLLPDVRLIAESAMYETTGGESCPEVLTPAARAARRILAALDSHECPECHMPGHHKMSCSRGGSKGGRFSVSLDSQGGEGE